MNKILKLVIMIVLILLLSTNVIATDANNTNSIKDSIRDNISSLPRIYSKIMPEYMEFNLAIANKEIEDKETFSETASEEWNKIYNLGKANSIKQTLDEGFIVAGEKYSSSGWRAILFKTDKKGNLVWSKIFYGGYFSSVQQTKDGGYVAVGYKGGANGGDAWFIKTDANGNKLWDKTFGETGYNYDDAKSIQQTKDGGYIIAGYTTSYGSGYYDMWLIKTNTYGNKLWDKTFGGTDFDAGSSVQQTMDGGYIIAGDTESYGAGHSDMYIVKTDTYGNKQWDKSIGDENWNSALSIQQTKDGGYIIAGFKLNVQFDSNLVKIDGNGNKKWDKILGEENWDLLRSIIQTNDGGYITVGYIASSSGNRNAWIIKTNNNGIKEWDKIFGGSVSDEEANSVQQTKDYGYIVAGFKDSNAWLIKLNAENLLKNPGFEVVYGSVPMYWIKFQTGTKAVFTYPEIGRTGTGKSVAISYPTKEAGKVALWRQDNIVVTPYKQYKLSGYMKLSNVIGSAAVPRPGGASIRVTWFNSNGGIIRTDLINKVGTIGWTRYEKIVTAPSNAVKAMVGGDLFDSSGKVWFDDLSFVKIS